MYMNTVGVYLHAVGYQDVCVFLLRLNQMVEALTARGHSRAADCLRDTHHDHSDPHDNSTIQAREKGKPKHYLCE